MGKSLAQRVAELPEEEREAILEGLDLENLQWDWDFWARPEQQPPETDWNIYLFCAGRGAGKTRSAAEWIRKEARDTSQGPKRFFLVGRTASDVRDVLIEGDSGIMSVHPPSEMPLYEPSKRRITFASGATALCGTADEPDMWRGPQAHAAWCDEMSSYRAINDSSGLDTWSNIRIATRLGNNPKILVTTTPKRVKNIMDLVEEAKTNKKIIIANGSTLDNAGNLSEAYIDAIYGRYKGTHLEKQELEGLLVDAPDGALWTPEDIDSHRMNSVPQHALRVVGVDPTVADRPNDECGIVVAGATGDRDLYKRQACILDDQTVKGAPDVWARAVVATARKWGAPVVAEKNQGGALIRNAINQIDPSIPVFEVWSKQGKVTRAEPVALAYQQGRVRHVGLFEELENQMCYWTPGDRNSPDRVDALVLALTALLVTPPKGFAGGSLTAQGYSGRRIPSAKTSRSTGRRSALYGAGFKRR